VTDCLSPLAQWARQTPEKRAILSPLKPAISFRDLWVRIEEIAADLRGLGLGAGDIIGISIPEGSELLIAALGTMRIAAAAPIDSKLTSSERQARLSLLRPRRLWTTADRTVLAGARPRFGGNRVDLADFGHQRRS
jgi:acyl-CoA synthetase (AMP-forming)/AMP-acid ligase II